MNTISYGTDKDLEEIINLWKICFPESPEFTNWYFKNIFSVSNTLLYKENNIICSMLQELNFKFSTDEKATYIYGACTHPNHRKKGLMGELLNTSFKSDLKKGINLSILIPENKPLFNFYKKFDYMPVTPIKTELYTNTQNINTDYIFIKARVNDIENINTLYENHITSIFIKRPKSYWETQINMFNSLGGNCFCLYDKNKSLVAYAFVWNEETLKAQEIIFINEKVKNVICSEIRNYFNNEKTLELKVYSSDSSNIENLACIKFHTQTKQKRDYLINLLYN